MKLKKLSIEDGMDIYQMLQGIDRCEHGFTNDVYGMPFDEYKKWLVVQENWSNGKDLPIGYVPQTVFWLYDNDRPVGYGKIRHKLTQRLMENGGTIGYAIAKEYRGKGYGNTILRLLLNEFKEMGLEDAVLTIMKKNEASINVAENNGGQQFLNNSEWVYYKFF